MCGIFASNDPEIPGTIGDLLERRLRFRGPDGSSGIIKKGEWKTYHSRLAIIDLAAGINQPVINPDGSQLIFNGEILNYKELGLKYFNRNYMNDTELLNDLILNRLLKTTELDGFFAFIFINRYGILTHACRDKFGVKPLFYYKTKNNHYTFSSEPSVLIDLYRPKINKSAIAEYHAFRYPIFSKSFYQGILEVEPGTCIINGRYFRLEDELFDQSHKPTNQADLERALADGVNSRCISDTPIGLLLSRGVDSNLIRYTGTFQNYYAIGFPEDEDIKFLESQNLKNLKIIKVNSQEYKDAFNHLLTLRNEPLSVPNEVLLYLVGKGAALDGVKVLLSGDGADEFFAGYDRIFKWSVNKKELDAFDFATLYCYSDVTRDSDIVSMIEDVFSGLNSQSVFSKVRWFFIKYHLPILFRRLDFSLMAAGVEGREPIANYHLFKIAKTLSGSDLMNGELGKLPLRKIMQKHTNPEFAFSQKVGFPVDLKNIFENPNNLSSYELWFQKNLEILN